MPKVKITVLKKTYHPDLVQEYREDGYIYGPCERVQDGQEFIVEKPWSKPEGMCTWAWADLRGDILAIFSGANIPGIKPPGVAIAVCSDAFRPVIFKIERVE